MMRSAANSPEKQSKQCRIPSIGRDVHSQSVLTSSCVLYLMPTTANIPFFPPTFFFKVLMRLWQSFFYQFLVVRDLSPLFQKCLEIVCDWSSI